MKPNGYKGLLLWTACGMSSLLAGCENPLDCLIDDRPVFKLDAYVDPVLNQVYDASIWVAIQNNVHDDDYDYTWRFEGVLPQGVSYEVTDRRLRFGGTATELGSYAFTLRVSVGNPGDFLFASEGPNASDLCRQNAVRTFKMVVAPQ